MSNKWCKGYCFKSDNHLDAKKVCKLPKCKNNERSKKLIKEASEKLLKEVERNLY